ncbi:MAG: hypothetical protein P8179_16950 [Candidatus Thiodiazotropha sp.]
MWWCRARQKSLLHIHVPPQACHSRCSVIHPVGDQGQLHYVDLMGLVEIPTQSQKAAGIRMTHFMIVV